MSDEKPVKFSHYNTTNRKNNELCLKLNTPLKCFQQEVCLDSLFVPYSWRNVSLYHANSTVSYIFNGTQRNLTIPDGYYSISDISLYIQLQMNLNGEYLLDTNGNPIYFLKIEENSIYYAATLTCTPVPTSLGTLYTNPNGITLSGNCPQLVITNAAFGTLIGFIPASFPAVTQTSIYQVNSTVTPVINPVSVVNVRCSLVADNTINYTYPDVIHTFTSSNITYGLQIPVEPKNRNWYPVGDQSYQSITLTLSDPYNGDIQVLDTDMTATIIIRPRRDLNK